MCSVIKPSIATKYGIDKQVINQTELHSVGGKKPAKVCLIGCLLLPNNIPIKPMRITVTDFASHPDILIGMDIILLGDLSIANHDNKTTFCFSMPPHNNTHSLDLHARALAKNPQIMKKANKKST